MESGQIESSLSTPHLHSSVVDPLDQSPELSGAEVVKPLFHVPRRPLQKDPRARARPAPAHEMNATARYSIRAVAFTFEKHVPRRGSTS